MATFGAPSTVVSAEPNFPSFTALVVNVPTANTAVQLPDTPIPDGAVLGLRAKITNGPRRIFLANSSANVLLSGSRIELRSGESVELRLHNLNAIWIASNQNNADLEILVEQ